MARKTSEKQRQRAPSKRSLETKARIMDAAERLFAERGFDGASIRHIARTAGVQGALVNHHGGSKEQLFEAVVARRAEELSRLRLDALKAAKQSGELTLRSVVTCFIAPFMELVFSGSASWATYGRLIAHVSSDDRWRHIAAVHFDPTMKIFLDEIEKTMHAPDKNRVAAAFVFMVSSMLSVCTSRWRIDTFAQNDSDSAIIDTLIDYCCAGFDSADTFGESSRSR